MSKVYLNGNRGKRRDSKTIRRGITDEIRSIDAGRIDCLVAGSVGVYNFEAYDEYNCRFKRFHFYNKSEEMSSPS